MGQEFELKFTAKANQQDAIRAAFGPWQKIDMETTYYDTADHALSSRHITLRRRMENGVSICTVKTPLSELARGEWECECSNIESAIAQLCRLGAPQMLLELTRSGLVAVCGARFTRLACTLALEGATAELALDQGILIGGGKELPLCEVEVEEKSGSRANIMAFATVLAEKHGLAPESKSKFRRSLELAEGE